MKLTEEQIAAKMEQAPDWKREDAKWISKRYRFKAFLTGIAFVNAVADIAERMNHHPLISIDYKTVTLRITSWNAGGLTDADFDSVAAYERAYAEVTAAG